MTDGETLGRPESENEARDRLKAGGAPDELDHVLDAVLERNAREVRILDLRGISDVADYFVIASGDSDTHVRAVAENILDRMRDAGVRPVGVEGAQASRWILIDFVTVIVHIFLPRVREFYQLERLWGDAPRFELT
jgi:ribosome-associated protein